MIFPANPFEGDLPLIANPPTLPLVKLVVSIYILVLSCVDIKYSLEIPLEGERPLIAKPPTFPFANGSLTQIRVLSGVTHK